ncbi:MAG: pyridoxamine 5'-phosphate oxidase family protein [Tannerella sp.]|jgi:general stress protein 26|nr:pyridoxamine 5'-phosphate oxidase family protein [Tannerella sp.]
MDLKLFHLGEISEMSADQVKCAEEFIRSLVFGTIATNNPETGARLSALNNLTGQTLESLHFGTDATSQKVKNIQANPHIEVMYTNANGGQIMLSGRAEILTDTETKKASWQEWMNEYSPEGPTGTGICIIRFRPEAIRAMIC